jgi:hypothetical protein
MRSRARTTQGASPETLRKDRANTRTDVQGLHSRAPRTKLWKPGATRNAASPYVPLQLRRKNRARHVQGTHLDRARTLHGHARGPTQGLCKDHTRTRTGTHTRTVQGLEDFSFVKSTTETCRFECVPQNWYLNESLSISRKVFELSVCLAIVCRHLMAW